MHTRHEWIARKKRKFAENSFRHGGTSGHGGMIKNPPTDSFSGGDGVDVINELPHPLLCFIISLLPVKQAVATSAVCQNWRDLWRYLVRLDINVTRRTTGDIKHVVDSQMNKVIDRCRIVISRNTGGLVDYVSWLESLRDRNGLQELQIVYNGGARPKFPTGFYRNLRVVEIDNYMHRVAGEAFVGCENLETLKLTNAVLKDETLAQIINHCPRLENLALVRCIGLVNFMIIKNDCRLKYLEIDYLDAKRFEFCLMNLRVLCLANFSCKSHNVRCPNLSVLRTSGYVPDILSRLCGLLGEPILSFYNVRELSCCLNLDKWYDLILLRFMLRASRNLQYLLITNKVYDDFDDMHRILPFDERLFWKGEPTDMKVVHIRGFQCRKKEMSLVRHLIQNEEVLEKLVIQFGSVKPSPEENSKKDPKESIEKAKQELSLLERASTDASIVFIDPESSK